MTGVQTCALPIWSEEAFKKQLVVAATYDQLTGLRNRNSFDEQYNVLLEAYHGEKVPFSVVVSDIDLFKIINDTYGHGFGDEVLISVTHIIEQAMRETDVVFRWGGEEFLILLSHADLKRALEVAERLRKLIEDTPIEVGEINVRTTMSFGVACFSGEQEAKNLIKKADEKLYLAKNNGRNKVEGYECLES